MFKFSSTILLALLLSIQSLANESWKLVSRHSFYTSETDAEILLHIPDKYLSTSFKVGLTIDGNYVFNETIDAEKSIYPIPVSIQGLGQASHIITANITGSSLDVLVKGELLCLPPKANSVKIDRLTGSLIINELPFFPFGFYCYSPLQPTLPEEEVVKGFNMFSPYQQIKSKTRDERKAYLDRAAELGMKVHYNLLSVAGGGGVGSVRDLTSTQEEKRKLLKEEIEAFMDHPALLAWYISDEPTGHGEDPEDLKNVYEFVKSIDPYHPVTIVFMAPMQARRYEDAMDIVMADPYPIPNNTAEGVGYVTRSLMNEFQGEKPVWIVPQAFGGSEHWGREPSIQELRAMTYLSLVNGATGIQYFIRHGLNGFPKSTASWGMAGQIALETNEIAPFILEGTLSDYAESTQDNIHIRSWEKDGQKVIMAVNENIKPGTVNISFRNIGHVKAEVLFESRNISIENNEINDFIDGYGRRVYLVGKATPKPININSRNMTRDPGFEELASPGVPSSCYARVGNDRGATYFTDPRVSVEGRHSIRMNTPANDHGCSLSFFPVMINSGSGYTLSVWAKYDSSSYHREEVKGFWKKLFKKKTDPNRYFTIGLGTIKSERFTLTNEWEKYSLTIHIPENSAQSSRVNPSLVLNSQGTAWFDALEMYPDPLIEYGVNASTKSFEVSVSSSNPEYDIKYNLDGSIPDVNSITYDGPVKLNKSTVFVAGILKDDKLVNYSSKRFSVHLATGKTPVYSNRYSERYNAGGRYGLVDGIRGSNNYTDGLWQGFLANDMVATIDLGENTPVSSVITGCLQDSRSWIFMPSSVSVYGSVDGEYFALLGKTANDVDQKASGSVLKDFKVTFDSQKIRYIRIVADNIDKCPEWHNGKGQGAYLFVDEIIVE